MGGMRVCYGQEGMGRGMTSRKFGDHDVGFTEMTNEQILLYE